MCASRKRNDSMKESKIPSWARCLLVEHAPSISVVWSKQKTFYSRGKCSRTRLLITAGYDKKDATYVLLHEISHALTPTLHHRTEFWETCFNLCRKHRLSSYAVWRSLQSSTARKVAVRLKLDQASYMCRTWEAGGLVTDPASGLSRR